MKIENKKVLDEVRSIVLSLFGTLILVVTLNTKVFANVTVEQCSMENTLIGGDTLILNKLCFKPKQGDIVVFLNKIQKSSFFDDFRIYFTDLKERKNEKNNKTNVRFIKRVIGVENDEIDIKDGFVYVNGKKLKEEYIKTETIPREIKFPLRVPKNQIFVLGDNREVSSDSRDFGCISLNQLEGKAVFRLTPLKKSGFLK
ncbi:signal peptidase I [Clostridium cavendishii DSM 21758]|uniref:Signal peptidase I n=1 Tax=Clostridium cavendishii DSM 21758 TaxID=1121302 RepID=A0A1M6FIR6_9CLOT|nr:signal peptidase I [Clostridium cavendishii]SHI97554.1 signal peptidase I [Clostridium cavendishii DSM 21758]